MSVGSRIRERRKSLKMTQGKLAKLLGITKGAVANYEREISSPKAEILYKLFELLECDANYIFQDYIPSEHLDKDLQNSLVHLNKEGRSKLKDYVDDLVSSGRYSFGKNSEEASFVSEQKTVLSSKFKNVK